MTASPNGGARGSKFVLLVPDGAADLHRMGGLSPIGEAHMPHADFVAREGFSGRMKTFYPDLPRESMVAQLGMLGWCPQTYYPHGRASCELLALEGPVLEKGDLACRANLVKMAGPSLVSYSADFILTSSAAPLVETLNRKLGQRFTEFELYHNSDFRNTLVIRGAGVDPRKLCFPEPHEHQGEDFDLACLVTGQGEAAQALALRINDYLVAAGEVLAGEAANAVFPWSPSRPFALPTFAEKNDFHRPALIIGFMDFLMGIARAGAMDCVRLGNGRPDTDYRAKGEKIVEALEAGYEFVVCHVNGPDEASHMGDRQLKIECLEAFDREVLGPTVNYFQGREHELGGVVIAPDHYTNHSLESNSLRIDAHSMDPVPVAVWNGRERDGVTVYSEDAALEGLWGRDPFHHLDLLRIAGVAAGAMG